MSQANHLCIYTALHGPQIEYAVSQYGENDTPFCFRFNKKWQAARKYLDLHESMPLLIRSIGDVEPTLAVTFTADLCDVWFADDFKSQKERRSWLEDALWVQREFYEEENRSDAQFRRQEIQPSLNSDTLFQIRKLRRVKRVPIDRLQKASGERLSRDYRYGYVVCQMPQTGSALYKQLTTAIDADEGAISDADLDELDRKYSGTPEYESKIVNAIRRPSAIRNALLRKYGTKCKLCGEQGFLMKNGKRYAETHHMIELHKQAPETLQSWNVIIVCPTCHKMLHHADASCEFLNPGWRVVINGKKHQWTK